MRTQLTKASFAALCLMLGFAASAVHAQSFGVETHNTLMPASGAMGGASLAQPQDLTSAMWGNPATLSQFHGTQFLFGGGWVEPTYNVQHAGGVLPNVNAFNAKSEMQGAAMGNIGLTQELSVMDMPVTMGMGFITAAGGGADFRQVPASNGTNSMLQVFELVNAVGMSLTDRLSIGANVALGIGMYDGPFVGIGGLTMDYALRASLGAAYQLTECTNVGFYYQTKQSFQFDNAIRLDLGGGAFSPTFDVNLDLPENLGLGFANRSLMDGNLLLACDILFKQWDNADMFRAVYDNQWVFQTGAQYSLNRWRFRVGYTYAQNPLSPNPGATAGGVAPPGAVAAIQYLQAQMAAINPHRISAGVGVSDVMPGVDFDLFAGGMFRSTQAFGASTSATVESYWIGFGLTWRFGQVAQTCSVPTTM